MHSLFKFIVFPGSLSIFEHFEPMNFITNFSIVGAGMLGIFIIIGIIILSVVILNAATVRKNKKGKKN